MKRALLCRELSLSCCARRASARKAPASRSAARRLSATALLSISATTHKAISSNCRSTCSIRLPVIRSSTTSPTLRATEVSAAPSSEKRTAAQAIGSRNRYHRSYEPRAAAEPGSTTSSSRPRQARNTQAPSIAAPALSMVNNPSSRLRASGARSTSAMRKAAGTTMRMPRKSPTKNCKEVSCRASIDPSPVRALSPTTEHAVNGSASALAATKAKVVSRKPLPAVFFCTNQATPLMQAVITAADRAMPRGGRASDSGCLRAARR